MNVLIAFQYICNSICIAILQRKLNYKFFFVGVTIVNAVLVSFLYGQIGTLATIYSFFSTVFIYWLTKQDFKRYLYAISIGLIYSILSDYLSNLISLFLLGRITLGSNLEIAYFHLMLSFLISLLITKSTTKLINEYFSWPLIVLSYGLLLTYYSVIVSSSVVDNRNSIFLMNFTFLIFYFILTAISIFLINQSLKQKYQSSIYQKEIEIQKEYIQKTTKGIDNLRKFQHNYRNVLYSLKIYIDESDNRELKNYFYEKIYPTKELFSTKTIAYSQLECFLNPSVRRLFEIKLIQAVINNIDVQLSIDGKIKISEDLEYPFNEVIGILMDNAIEEMTENKYSSSLKIRVNSKNNRIVFTFENPILYKENLFLLKQKGYSTKSSGRGLGLSILDDIVNNISEFSLRTKVSNDSFCQILILDKSEEKQ